MAAGPARPGLRVLVAFDDCPSAWRGLLGVPALHAESVVLLTVLEDCADLALEAAASRGKSREDTPEARRLWLQLQEARTALERARDALLREGWAGDCQLVLRCGKAGAEIVSVAAEQGCETVVMGAHASLGVRRPLLGPVATDVLRRFDGGGVYLVR